MLLCIGKLTSRIGESRPVARGVTSVFITSHVVFLVAPLPTMHAIARIGLVDYYGKVFAGNDAQMMCFGRVVPDRSTVGPRASLGRIYS